MTKTLVVSYTPREEKSNTKKLVDYFLEQISGEEIEKLELSREHPDMFTPEILKVYYKRNYDGKKLSDMESKLIAKMDFMTKQVKESDIVVIAYPMYNFSMPAAVKAYFDSIMQKGETWESDKSGSRGMMKDRNALVISTSGGSYEGQWELIEFSTRLARQEFEFMGFSDIRVVFAQGLGKDPEKDREILEKAKEDISAVIEEWYAKKR